MTEFERMQEFSKGALIAELEKIKAEIETYRNCLIPYVNDENDYCKGRIFSYDVASALLEKRIGELKEKDKLTCDRNICLKNEYNNIGCEDCVVTKGNNK